MGGLSWIISTFNLHTYTILHLFFAYIIPWISTGERGKTLLSRDIYEDHVLVKGASWVLELSFDDQSLVLCGSGVLVHTGTWHDSVSVSLVCQSGMIAFACICYKYHMLADLFGMTLLQLVQENSRES